MKKLLIDVETRSKVDLKKAGARRYAADPSTQITTACWKWAASGPAGPVYSACNIPGLEHLGNSTMAVFLQAVADADHIVAHHINFDANVIMATLGPCGLALNKLDCTMARAQRMSLPGGLDELCLALGVPGKSLDGHRLVMATCKPRKDGTFNEDEIIFRQLLSYNVQDVRCLESVDRLLPPLPPEELEIWQRTWRKNAFGLPLDLELLQRVAARREEIEAQLATDLFQLTGGAVTQITQRARIIEWLHSKGVKIPNTQRATLESWLDGEQMPFEAWAVLTNLFESGGSAPTKAQALLDRHVWGVFQDGTRYFGARSGRGTSEGVNMFNLARPSGKYEPADVINQLKLAAPGRTFNNTELSDVLRGAIVAPPGMSLIDVDLSSIELRLALWYAGDREKLSLLTKKGADLYAYTAGRAMGIPDLTKHTHPKERQAYKKVVLSGCLSARTEVLTRDGWKYIVDVNLVDELWDGESWVRHEGLIYSGTKETMNLSGVTITEDHLVLCGTGWSPARDVATTPDSLCLALATALVNLPCQATRPTADGDAPTFLFSALAGRLSLSKRQPILLKGGQPLAGPAAEKMRGLRATVSTALALLVTPCLRAGWRHGSIVSTSGVTTAASQTSSIMARGVLGSFLHGLKDFALGRAGVASATPDGSRPGSASSLSIFSLLTGAVTQLCSWTALITTGATNRATFASLRQPKTGGTSAASQSRLAPTYDLLNCGPRHRFMILSSAGPLLVHNSYQIGVDRLYAAFKTDKDLPYEYRRDLTLAQVTAIHAGYRDENVPLQMAWRGLDDAARNALYYPGALVPACDNKLGFIFRKEIDQLQLILPSGRIIPHYRPKINEEGELTFWRARYGRMLESRTFGGALLEIACFAQDTLLATEYGLKRITDVTLQDRLWDGKNWVSHGGVVSKGIRRTACLEGVRVTGDHQMLCLQHTRSVNKQLRWRTVNELNSCSETMRMAKDAGRLLAPPLRASAKWTLHALRSSLSAAGSTASQSVVLCFGIARGTVVPSTSCVTATAALVASSCSKASFSTGPQKHGVALHAPPSGQVGLASESLATLPLTQLLKLSAASFASLVARIVVATTQKTGTSKTTARAASMFLKTGVFQLCAALLNLVQAAQNGRKKGSQQPRGQRSFFSLTCSRLKAMTILRSSWTGLTTTGVTNRETCASLQEPKTSITAAPSASLRAPEPVFDILDCGPNNRFTIVTPTGCFLLAHNCQSAARDILTGVERQIEAELPDVRLLLDIYDSVVALAPTPVAETRMNQMLDVMRRVPPWAAGLPLNGEGYFADRMQK